MTAAFVDDLGRRALGDAVAAVERASSVEVVVAVRPQSGTYLHADLIAGVLVGVAALAFLMFSPWPFSHVGIAAYPLVAGAAAALGCSRWPALRRRLSPRSIRTSQVETGAHAAFHLKEVGLTTRRTGMLVYVSLLERRVVVLPDRAIVDAVGEATWRPAIARLETALERGRDARELATALTALVPVLAAALPRAADDRNELADEVGVV